MDDEKGQLPGPGVFIGLMVLVIVGLALTFNVTGDLESQFLDTFTVNNENHTISSTPETFTVNQVDANKFLVNGSETLTDEQGNTLTAGNNYTVESEAAGRINVTDLGQITLPSDVQVDYDYRFDSYVENATERTVINLLPILVLLIIVVGIVGAAGFL